MKRIIKNENGFSHVAIAVITVVVLSAVGFIAFRAYNTKKNVANSENKQNASTESKETSVASQEKAEEAIPAGYVKYDNKDLGFSFAYPQEWGALEKTPNSIDTIYSAGFSSTKVFPESEAVSVLGGYNVILYANSGLQDFTTGGRGGALWDCVGFESIQNRFLCRNVAIRGGILTSNNSELVGAEKVKAINTVVALDQYNYFGEEVFNLYINLKGKYYGAAFVVNGNNQQHKDQLKQVAKTIKVN